LSPRLSQDEVNQAAEAATTPAARLVLVLAAMHAARFKAIREIRLDDVDLGNRRITIGGRAPPLDDLTRQVLLEVVIKDLMQPATGYSGKPDRTGGLVEAVTRRALNVLP
jgi:hypothetical protein